MEKSCDSCRNTGVLYNHQPCINCTNFNKYMPKKDTALTLEDLQDNLKVSVICPTRNIVKVSVWYGNVLLTSDEDEL